MKNKNKFRIRQISNFLTQVMPFMILGMVIFFGLAILQFQADNRILLEQTKRSAENTEIIIKNLDQAVKDLKADNQKNTAYLNCLLAAHDVGQFETSECIDDAMSPTSHSEANAPQQETTQPAPQTTPPSEGNPPPQPVDEGLIPDSIPIIGGLL